MNRRNVLKMMAASLLSGCIPRKKEERYIVDHVVLNSKYDSYSTNSHYLRLSASGEKYIITPRRQDPDYVPFYGNTAFEESESQKR